MTKKAKEVLTKKQKSPVSDTLKSLVPGAAAGVVGSSIVMPIDVTSDTQRQWQRSKSVSAAQQKASKSFLGTAKQIHRESGIKGFYSGYAGKMLKIAPSMAITFLVQDALRKKLEKKASAIPGGKQEQEQRDPKSFDPKSIQQGMKVEREHSPRPAIQKQIAMDHLTEDPQYYRKLKKMEKKADVYEQVKKKVTQKIKEHPVASAAIAAGATAYAGARYRPFSAAARKARKMPATMIYESEPGTKRNLLDTVRDYMVRGDFKQITIDEAKSLKKPLSGHVYFDVDQNLIPKKVPIAKDAVVFNRSNAIGDVLQDKLHFGQLKHPTIMPTKTIHQHAGKHHKDLLSFSKALVSQKRDWYYKPRSDYASGGGGHIDTQRIRTSMRRGVIPKVVQRMYENPEGYIAQHAIDFVPTRKGNPSEYRAHFHIAKGKVSPIGGPTDRWDWTISALDRNRPRRQETTKALQEIVNQNPKFKRRLSKANLIVGADVTKDKGGKLRFVEINDQSGFMEYPMWGQPTYRAVTGRDSRAISALKGTAAAGVAATGASLLPKPKANKNGKQ